MLCYVSEIETEMDGTRYDVCSEIGEDPSEVLGGC